MALEQVGPVGLAPDLHYRVATSAGLLPARAIMTWETGPLSPRRGPSVVLGGRQDNPLLAPSA